MKKIHTERPFLFTPNVGIAVNIHIAGNPSNEQIEAAISKAVFSNESLCSKIVLQDNGDAFYKGTKPNYKIYSGNEIWIELVEAFPLHPLDIFNGEMVRFYIIRNTDGLQLLTIGHHLAGDGLSFIFLMEDIMRALNGEEIPNKPLQILNVKNLPKRSGLPFLKKGYLQRLNKQWRKSGQIFNIKDYYQLLDNYAKEYSGSVIEHKLSEVSTGRLLEYSKSVGISINSLVVTALLKGYGEAANVGIAVSVREPGNKGMGNWVSGIKFDGHYDTTIDLKSNAEIVQKKIYNLLDDKKRKNLVLHFLNMMDGSLIDSACMTKYLGYSNPESAKITNLMHSSENLRDIGVTNLTRAMIPSFYGQYSITAMAFVPPVVPYCKRTVGIVTFENKMSITMNTIAADKEKDFDFLSQAIEICKNRIQE